MDRGPRRGEERQSIGSLSGHYVSGVTYTHEGQKFTASHEFVDGVPKINRDEINFSTVVYACTGVLFELSFKAYLPVMRSRAKSIKGCHQEARKLPMPLPLY